MCSLTYAKMQGHGVRMGNEVSEHIHEAALEAKPQGHQDREGGTVMAMVSVGMKVLVAEQPENRKDNFSLMKK